MHRTTRWDQEASERLPAEWRSARPALRVAPIRLTRDLATRARRFHVPDVARAGSP